MRAKTRSNERRRRYGLSTIEVVTVIAVTGILSVGLAGILRHPLQGYAAVSRRSELVELADLALLRMSRDLRMALPNSVRVSADKRAIELLHVAAGARYRAEPGVNPNGRDHSDASDWLSFGGDSRWNLLGRVSGFAFSYGTPLAAGTRVAIYSTGSDVWTAAAANGSTSVISASSNGVTLVDDGDEDQIVLASSHRFSLASPRSRLYLVDTPVTYLCDVAANVLWRVDRYAVDASQPTSLGAAPLASGASARTAERIERCSFDYLPGTPARSGLVTLEIVIESDDERVRLLHQVPIPNAP
jgi:MSHA biogenesis protein MshO